MPEYEIFDLGHLAVAAAAARPVRPAGRRARARRLRDGRTGRHAGHHRGAGRVHAGAARPAGGHHVLGHRHRPHRRCRSCSPRSRPAGTCGSAWRTPSRTPRASRWSRNMQLVARAAGVRPAGPAPADDHRPRPGPCSACPPRCTAYDLDTLPRPPRRDTSAWLRGRRRRSPRWSGPGSWRAATAARSWCSTPAGRVVAAVGDVDRRRSFPRSSNKPMQAVGMLRSGLALADPADLALVAASHSGEPCHVERVRSMLRRGGPDRGRSALPARPAAVRGGPRRPCSGRWRCRHRVLDELLRQAHRHAADLCGGRLVHRGLSAAGPPAAAGVRGGDRGPRRRAGGGGRGGRLRRTGARDLADRAGPGVPAAVSQAGPGDAGPAGRRRDAGASRARLRHRARGRPADAGVPGLLAKVGAEGVFAVAAPGLGAVALKIDDGAMRAARPVLVGRAAPARCGRPDRRRGGGGAGPLRADAGPRWRRAGRLGACYRVPPGRPQQGAE